MLFVGFIPISNLCLRSSRVSIDVGESFPFTNTPTICGAHFGLVFSAILHSHAVDLRRLRTLCTLKASMYAVYTYICVAIYVHIYKLLYYIYVYIFTVFIVTSFY